MGPYLNDLISFLFILVLAIFLLEVFVRPSFDILNEIFIFRRLLVEEKCPICLFLDFLVSQTYGLNLDVKINLR